MPGSDLKQKNSGILDAKARLILLVCFFASGVCGLVYEITWLRVLSLTFGNTTFATSTILSSYMAGLGLGALYFGRRIDRSTDHPVRFYGWLEGGVGVYALLTPLLWKLIEWISVGFYRAAHPPFLVFNLFKFALAFVALFPPTFLMGGTLPVVSKYFVERREDTGRYVGLLYALNTLGAVLGVLFSGFYAIYYIGVWQTVYIAGAANLLIFWGFRNFGKGSLRPVLREDTVVHASTPALPKFVLTCLLALFGASGAVSMMYELAWTRVLAIELGSSVYAFTVMLATFLLGIALGSYVFSLTSKKFKADLPLFALFQLLTAASVFWGINQFNEMPYQFVRLFERTGGAVLGMEIGKFMLCARVMLVPTLLFGAMFTCFIQAVRSSDALGHEVGRAYFANTIGTILGSALTGFWILPLIGIQKTLIAGAAANAVIGVLVFVLRPAHFRFPKLAMQGAGLALVALAVFHIRPWNLTMISSDTAVKPGNAVHLTRQQFFGSFRERETIFYKDGLGATVTVVRLKDNLSLAVNGKVDASNGDAFTQYLLGHLPMILTENPKKVLVIGLGSASTLAAVAAHPVEEIHAVELEKAVVEAAALFPDLNRNVLQDPRVHMFVNDGRNFLMVQPDKYDVIVSEPSNPWMAGVANLFSLEHFQNMSRHLKPGGVACQWLHAYSMSREDLAMIIRTFSKGFPYVQLWTSYYPDLMLLGFNEPRTLDLEQVRLKFEQVPFILKDLGPHGIKTPEALLGSFFLDDPQLRILGSEARMNRDNLPYLEFSAPRSLYRQTLDENYRFLEDQRDLRLAFLKTYPPVQENLFLFQQVARGLLAKKMFRDVTTALEQAHRISGDNAENSLIAGMMAVEMQNYEQAQGHLEHAQKLGLDTPELHYYLGVTYSLRNNETEKGLVELAAAVQGSPAEGRYWKDYAEALAKLSRWDEAVAAFEKIIELNNGHKFEALSRITDIRTQTGDHGQQLAAQRRMAEAYPRYAPSYLELGRLYEEGHQLPEAAEAYRRFSDFLPDHPAVWISLARVYDGLGKTDEMVSSMKRAVELEPQLAQHPEVRKILGQ